MKGSNEMNFYNPYYFPYQNIGLKSGLNNIFKRINFNSIMNGAERGLNIVNQIIPIIKQAKPVIGNAKTMFKLMSEFNRGEETKKATSTEVASKTYNEGPTFFG